MALIEVQRYTLRFRVLLVTVLLSGVWLGAIASHLYLKPFMFSHVRIDSARIKSGKGKAFKFSLPHKAVLNDQDVKGAGVTENGIVLPLKPPAIAEVEQKGGGRFRVKTNVTYFSTTDDTSPITNGRRYELRIPRSVPTLVLPASLLVFVVCLLRLAMHAESRPVILTSSTLLLAAVRNSGRISVVVLNRMMDGLAGLLGLISMPDDTKESALNSQPTREPDRR